MEVSGALPPRELGIMAGRESFGISMQNNPVQSQSVMQSMRLAYAPDGTAIYKPIGRSSSPPHPAFQGGGGAGGGGGGVSGGAADATSPTMPAHGLNINSGEPVKRKRGRPRKYGPDGTVALALAPVSSAAPMTPGSAGFSPASGATNTASTDPTKKARGRPPGSGKKIQMAALGSPGIGFTPHVITVNTGEDVSSKIMSFSQNGRRAICILSANGAISNVTLRQAASSGGSITYEGRFEILSLSGSFPLTESSGQRSRTGGLSISLAGSDGRVLGGGVAGLLTAASPVQVVVGSFIANGKKDPKQNTALDSASAPGNPAPAPVGMSGASSPTSRGTLSESSGGPRSPLNQSTDAFNNSNLPGFSNLHWK